MKKQKSPFMTLGKVLILLLLIVSQPCYASSSEHDSDSELDTVASATESNLTEDERLGGFVELTTPQINQEIRDITQALASLRTEALLTEADKCIEWIKRNQGFPAVPLPYQFVGGYPSGSHAYTSSHGSRYVSMYTPSHYSQHSTSSIPQDKKAGGSQSIASLFLGMSIGGALVSALFLLQNNIRRVLHPKSFLRDRRRRVRTIQ